MKQLISILAATTLLAAAPASEGPEKIAPLGTYKPAERAYWAFLPRKNAVPPALALAGDKAWIKTPIDAFILANLKKNGLKPAPVADRVTLIRRATYDLHGIPPAPEEIDAFVTALLKVRKLLM